MQRESESPTNYRSPSLANRFALVRLVLISAAAAWVVVYFAYVVGWLSPAADFMWRGGPIAVRSVALSRRERQRRPR